jgi:hypothetical protein
MARKKVEFTKRLAYLAYSLGSLPFVLMVGMLLQSVPKRKSPSLARCYERAVAEGLEAICALQGLAKGQLGPEADAARQAINRRWECFKDHCLGWLKPGDTWNKEEGWHQENLLADVFAWQDNEWPSFSAAIAAFFTCLPKPGRDFAALGSAIGDFVTRWPAGRTEVEEVLPAALHLQALWDNVAEEQEALLGLKVDLSVAAHQMSESRWEYWAWTRLQARSLHEAIVRRLDPSRSACDSTPTYIRACQ